MVVEIYINYVKLRLDKPNFVTLCRNSQLLLDRLAVHINYITPVQYEVDRHAQYKYYLRRIEET